MPPIFYLAMKNLKVKNTQTHENICFYTLLAFARGFAGVKFGFSGILMEM